MKAQKKGIQKIEIRNLVFHIQNQFFRDSWKSSLNFRDLMQLKETAARWNFFSWSSLSSDNSHVCVKLMFTYSWKRKCNYIMWLLRERGRAQGTRSPASAPPTDLVMGWLMLKTPQHFVLFNRDLEKSGRWQYSDFLLKKAKEQERLVLFSGEQPGAYSYFGQW